jgi:hypothetical protein
MMINTSLTLHSLHASAKTHFDDMSAAQREALEHVGLRADEIGNTLATVNAELPDILKVFQTILDQFQTLSQNFNENLILLEHIIKSIGRSGGVDTIQSIILAATGIVILKSINSWTAMSVLATLSILVLSIYLDI